MRIALQAVMCVSTLLHWMAERIKGLCPLSANNWLCANLFRQASEVTDEIKTTIRVSSKCGPMVLVMNDLARWSFVDKRKISC